MKLKKNQMFLGLVAAGVLLGTIVVRADDADQKVERRVQIIVNSDDDAAGADEPTAPVTFLGVQTTGVSETLAEQIGLKPGFGLVVQRVLPDSGATDVLKKHDVLTKFEDQLLVGPEQLGALVRSKSDGETVKLTIVRGGKISVVAVKLSARKLPQPHVMRFYGASGERGGMAGDGRLMMGSAGHAVALHQGMPHEDVDRLIAKVNGNGPRTAAGFTWVGGGGGDGPVQRMLSLGDGNVLFTDDAGVIELKKSDDGKQLTVKARDGSVIFEGPVNSEEQRNALTDEVKARLKKVENIETLEFRTGPHLETEVNRIESGPHSVRVVRPELEARGVRLVESEGSAI